MRVRSVKMPSGKFWYLGSREMNGELTLHEFRKQWIAKAPWYFRNLNRNNTSVINKYTGEVEGMNNVS